MSVATDQALLESSAREVIALGIIRMAEYMAEDNVDIEVVTKIVNSKIADIAKVIPEKKIDPYAGLPTVNVTFVNGSMQATITMAPPALEEVEEVVDDAIELPSLGMLMPTASMLVAATAVNADLGGLEA